MDLTRFGWRDFFESQVETTENLARVVEAQRGFTTIDNGTDRYLAEMSGQLHYVSDTVPVVGDWVRYQATSADRAIVTQILNRETKFSRKETGKAETEQTVAANVDLGLVVTSVNDDLNPRRIERYFTMVWDSGAHPGLVLTKTDLCRDRLEEIRAKIAPVVVDIPVVEVCALEGEGLDDLTALIPVGQTAVLLGSSGVGKSTLINALLGEAIQAVREIREGDGKGRHTTTSRMLFHLPHGGMLIDTPGMRELQLWEGGEGVDQVFSDITDLMTECKYSDCSHESEKGCAVQEALKQGALDADRYASYLKLQREIAFHASRKDKASKSEQRKRQKKFHKEIKYRVKDKQRGRPPGER